MPKILPSASTGDAVPAEAVDPLDLHLPEGADTAGKIVRGVKKGVKVGENDYYYKKFHVRRLETYSCPKRFQLNLEGQVHFFPTWDSVHAYIDKVKYGPPVILLVHLLGSTEGDYRKVEVPQEVFGQCDNLGQKLDAVRKYGHNSVQPRGEVPSVAVGDIIHLPTEDADLQHYLIQSFGYFELTEEQYGVYKALSKTDRTLWKAPDAEAIKSKMKDPSDG